MNIYNHILQAKNDGNKLLAVLIDPDKFQLKNALQFIDKVNKSIITHIFIGGSEVGQNVTQQLVEVIKMLTDLPIVLFPGDVTQISKDADAILFLSLLSGRNPDYLIDKQVQAVPLLEKTQLEVISTGYILIESGKTTAVQRVTNTLPLNRTDVDAITNTAKAGELLGKKLIYLEAGSGATYEVPAEVISSVKNKIDIPLIVGGGIRTKRQIENAFIAGADLVVIGTAFEEDQQFFEQLKH
ncbi:geranylgeranylglyceryl/heptaprenylglyceryl phosphate synthase [Mesoflavibacter sp. HG96]|uniref:geranylgeranylglyceryl/heptaprenylglyceryl phosphate synthase n=1 Tax=Mesoflavibacter TaxID=444051 RepID=UPI0013F42261|nr:MULTISPECIES: geranylgeranylglyceryl/heptaprenylglyceryl phosphate synthase [Mesoflavibacter]QIJ88654.1 geranylgeranylglyceryl/heptaprenylglyceryl phosphate synthase [Mesoflavibacter sp. HG96]QIJ91382.1 geranylgeranylglyceryl/heptaprenylglyceryl phosphate synthase [Mesoflavibacter sp. HG37]